MDSGSEISKLQISSDCPNNHKTLFKAPLCGQAFDWFREEYKLFPVIDITIKSEYLFSIYDLTDKRNAEIPPMEEIYYNNYEQARQACLKKLIELCKNR